MEEIENGESGLIVRNKINGNFGKALELDQSAGLQVGGADLSAQQKAAALNGLGLSSVVTIDPETGAAGLNPDAIAGAVSDVAEQAAIATTKAGEASASAAEGAASTAQAEIYASTAATSAKYYGTKAEGNTAVSDGATFGVKAGGTDGYTRPKIFRRDSDGASTEILSQLPATEFDVLNDAAAPVVAQMTVKGSETDGMHRFLWEAPDGTRYLLSEYRDGDGAFMPTRLVIPSGTVGAADVVPTEVIHGHRWTIDGRLAMTLDTTQGLYPRRMTIPSGAYLDDDLGNTLAARLAIGGVAPSLDLHFIGDSFMTVAGGGSTYPALMAASLGRASTVIATGGQTSTQQTAWQGSKRALLTITGDEVPTSGAVTVTDITTRFLSTPATTAATRNVSGTLAGVPGVLTCVESASGDSFDTYTFTRSTSGAAVFCAPATPFIPDQAHRRDTTVIGIGRNNVGDLAGILSDVAGAVAYLGHTNYLIVGVTNGSTEPTGTTGYNNVIALNRALATAYGERYVDIREYLIRRGLSDAGLTATPQDTIDIANDVIPEQLRSDSLHLSGAANVLVSALMVSRINYLGF